MPQIKPSHLILSMAVALALGGCGDKNPQAVYSAEAGGHTSDWVASHKTSAKAALESCVSCHGENLDGGISKVSCTACHIGSSTAIHPLQWGNYAYARHKKFVEDNGTSSCATAVCHGAALTSCAIECHLGGTLQKHPAVWPTLSGHKGYLATIENISESCKASACHGTDGKGVFLSGPACDQCHSMK